MSSSSYENDSEDVRRGRLVNDLFDRALRRDGQDGDPPGAGSHSEREVLECIDVVGRIRSASDQIEALLVQGLLARSADPRYAAELGPYRIVDFIGRGGMGIVLKAFDTKLHRIVALKILRPDLAGDARALARFEREARAAAALNHPNIVTVFAIGTTHGAHYIAMEYVGGPTLADLIRDGQAVLTGAGPAAPGPRDSLLEPAADDGSSGDAQTTATRARRLAPVPLAVSAATPASLRGSAASSLPRPLPNALVRDIFCQLLDALAAAHAAGLIHRDVKPSNILLDVQGARVRGARAPSEERALGDSGRRPATNDTTRTLPDAQSPLIAPRAALPVVKLADFGLARIRGSTTQLTLRDSVLGTPDYMSPEQARGDEDIDHRTDLYSAGVVLYEMLTGRAPFHADTPTATIHRILYEEPQDPLNVDESADPVLASVALRLMAKRREDRIASAESAVRLLHGKDAGRRHIDLRVPGRRWRWAVGCIAAFTLALIVFSWLLGSPVRTVAARIDPNNACAIQIRHEGSSKWSGLHVFAPTIGQVNWVQLARFDDGEQRVVVGTRRPQESASVFGFDTSGRRVWSLDLSADCAGWDWPNFRPPVNWCCRSGVLHEIDDNPGAELVVLADDLDEYPARISIVSSRDGRLLSTFWHLGKLAEPVVLDDLFGQGHAGILVWGENNKLDGADDDYGAFEARDGDAAPVTDWDHVSVMMLLDPWNMDGLGPPVMAGLPVRPAAVRAYAFIDLSTSLTVGRRDETKRYREPPAESEVAEIERVDVIEPPIAAEGPWFRVQTRGGGYAYNDAVLLLDRNLALHRCTITNAPEVESQRWRRIWKVLIPPEKAGRNADQR